MISYINFKSLFPFVNPCERRGQTYADNVGICHQIALYCASNSGKTLKVLGKHLHKLRQRGKNIQGRSDESPPGDFHA